MRIERLLLFFLCIVTILSAGCPKPAPSPALPDASPQTAKKAATAPAADQPPFYRILKEGNARNIARKLSPDSQGIHSWTEYRSALEDNLGYILRKRSNSVCVRRPGLTLTWGQLGDSVAELMAILPRLDEQPGLLAERFSWLKVSPETLLTGYYEPWLDASLTPDATYRYPLYGVPDDLRVVDLGKFHSRWKGERLVYRMDGKKIEPYPDRRAIDGHEAISGKGYEIAWAKDPVDVFFLQIQGSGRLVLPDGTSRHILYNGRNGRRYVSLGRVLIKKGLVPRDEMSMQRIRKFLSANPEEARQLMFENPSYVFFRLSDKGPFGAINVMLKPWVSVAVDPSMIPLGGACVLSTSLGDVDTGKPKSFRSLVLAQDTGGAIQGTRMDLFCGSSPEAEKLAGHLQEPSDVYLLVSRQTMASVKKSGQLGG
ncbi:murein transglycosylase A [Pseudodesulfovibrio sp.]|uniref:murein transglycosylase A n=1 Tax=unclassified Pseudodesulfovibrio TaxID=2661612 RepID=UPI003B004426